MSDVLERFGLKQKEESNLAQTLFYFIKELHINPLDEEYIVTPVYEKEKIKYLKVTKKGMPLSLFNSLLEEMNTHYRKEKAEYDKAKRKR